jgi:hypothetical protein
MVGIEVRDIEQELWAEFFRIHEVETCDEQPGIPRWRMLERLEQFASKYKKDERASKYGTLDVQNKIIEEIGAGNAKLNLLQQAWDKMVASVVKEDAMLMKHMAKGFTNKRISEIMRCPLRTVERNRARLLRAFRKEIEDNVQISFSERHSYSDEGV